MKHVDYIIVGCGLASIAFCEKLREHNKTFIVYDDASQKSSIVAAGLYNPVILKRFTPVWKSSEQLKIALPVYSKIEKELNIKVDHKLRILRRFASIEEQNLWFSAADKPNLEDYMSINLVKNQNDNIIAPFGFGEVLHAGRIDTEKLINAYRTFLSQNSLLISERFDYDELQINSNEVKYKEITSNQIVFAEGFGVKQNPFFKSIELNGNKGEILTIKSEALKIDYAIKSSIFVIPLGNDLYNVGATYDRDDKSNLPTKEGKEKLLSKLRELINCDFEVVDHVAGIRPTTKDRRPIVGQYKEFKKLYVLNGLGTRGVMNAPYVADQLFNHIEKGKPLDAEININRF